MKLDFPVIEDKVVVLAVGEHGHLFESSLHGNSPSHGRMYLAEVFKRPSLIKRE